MLWITLCGVEWSMNKVLKTNAIRGKECRGIQAQWLEVIIPIRPFLLDVLSHVPHQPACAHRDPGGKPSGMRVYCPSLRFSQSTLDDSGRNRGGPLPVVWAACPQLAPTQGCQELSCTECKIRAVVATRSTLMSLLP